MVITKKWLTKSHSKNGKDTNDTDKWKNKNIIREWQQIDKENYSFVGKNYKAKKWHWQMKKIKFIRELKIIFIK